VRFYEEIRKEKQQRARKKKEIKSNKGLAKENKGYMKEAERIKEIQKHGHSRRKKATSRTMYL